MAKLLDTPSLESNLKRLVRRTLMYAFEACDYLFYEIYYLTFHV